HRPSLPSSLFFFYCSSDHLYLHSFPTRRSSDLLPELHVPEPFLSLHDDSRCFLRGITQIKDKKVVLQPWSGIYHRVILLLPREKIGEHTSELQSLAYLVCRLLLEKKNRTINKLQ